VGGGFPLRSCAADKAGVRRFPSIHNAHIVHSPLHPNSENESALRDSRFPPIAARELPSLSCGVSLLSSFEPASGWDDWEVGTHGLIIEFTDPAMRCRRTATFLPEVAAEQGWDKEATLDALIKKAGACRGVGVGVFGGRRGGWCRVC
jgi:hypothetical protein